MDRSSNVAIRDADAAVDAERRRGRGASTNASGRFEPYRRVVEDDGWGSAFDLPPLPVEITREAARKIITRNKSPDISCDRSINPYRGCEHGCVYCFARPTHSYLGLSPGLDFESKLTVKPNAAELLERELSDPAYEVRVMAMGTNTDPYQPIERTERITRAVLEVLHRTRHPVGIVTKSALVQRDIDILAPMAAQGLAKVGVSVTTLDRTLARTMEPRAPTPSKRLETIKRLSDAGIPTMVMVAPIIPMLTDPEIERILDAAKAAGAREAGYVLLRLPNEIKELFQQWLKEHRPDALNHVMSLVRSTRGGKAYDSAWGKRMTGDGVYAWTIARRFEAATKRLGLNRTRMRLRTDLFVPPARAGEQLRLL
jgi:DNA repair photolyase